MKKVALCTLAVIAMIITPVLPISLGSGIGSNTASAASCVRYWRVVWSYAGIYSEPSTNSNVRQTLQQGDLLCQTSRSAPGGWIYIDNGAYPNYGYVRQAAITPI